MKNKFTWFTGFFLVVLAACTTQKQPLTVHNMETPPGTNWFSDNFFVDEAEVTNFNWLEYMFYTKKAYGSQSPQYLAALPDTLVWKEMGDAYINYYLRHPAYRDYPVVGISWNQACDFAQWRSDRVMEYILVREKLIVYRETRHPDTVFTIQKYFKGQYLGYQPEADFRFYPQYALPDSVQWKKISHVSDSLNIVWMKKYGPRLKEPYPYIHSAGNIPTWDEEVMVPVVPGKFSRKEYMYWYLRGNAREWSAYDGLSFGGGWADSLSTILSKDIYTETKPNAWTGFRNICTWKVWE